MPEPSSTLPHEAAVVVVGAGPAGLAAGAALGMRGIEAVLLDGSSAVGASWQGRYDRLHLNTSRHLSRLPGYGFARSDDRWPTRDQVVAYLERFARHHRLRIELDTEVRRVDPREGSGWILRTSRGDVAAASIVVATGHARTPVLPPWPGRESFPGPVVHSSAYRNATPYRGRNMLVAGAGDSAADIAVDLAEGGGATVWLSIRTPTHVIPRSTLGVPTDVTAAMIHRLPPRMVDPMIAGIARIRLGDLTRFGMPRPTQGMYARFLEHRRAPIIDPGDFVRALRSGRIRVVSAVERFEDSSVRLADGSALPARGRGRRHRLPSRAGGPRGAPGGAGPRRLPRCPRSPLALAGPGPVLPGLPVPVQRELSAGPDRRGEALPRDRAPLFARGLPQRSIGARFRDHC